MLSLNLVTLLTLSSSISAQLATITTACTNHPSSARGCITISWHAINSAELNFTIKDTSLDGQSVYGYAETYWYEGDEPFKQAFTPIFRNDHGFGTSAEGTWGWRTRDNGVLQEIGLIACVGDGGREAEGCGGGIWIGNPWL